MILEATYPRSHDESARTVQQGELLSVDSGEQIGNRRTAAFSDSGDGLAICAIDKRRLVQPMEVF